MRASRARSVANDQPSQITKDTCLSTWSCDPHGRHRQGALLTADDSAHFKRRGAAPATSLAM